MSIIDIDVKDERFQAFLKLWGQYQSALKAAPAHWEAQAESAQGLGGEIAQMTSALLAQAELHNQEAKALEARRRTWNELIRQQDRVVKSYEKQFKLVKSIAGSVMSLLSFSSLAGLASGALGLWGLDRLAANVSGSRRAAQGLGVTSGEKQAYDITLGRYLDTGANLQNIADAQSDYTKRWAFAAMGVNPVGKDPAALGAEMALRAKEVFDRGDQSQQYAQAHGLLQFYSMDELRRLHNTSRAELAGAVTQYRSAAGALALDDDTARKWQDFLVNLDLAKSKIFRTFVQDLAPLEPELKALTSAVAESLDTFLKNPHLKDWIREFGEGVKKVAEYVSSDKFQTDVKTFVDDFDAVVKAIVSGLQWLGVIPKAGAPGAPPVTGAGGTTFPYKPENLPPWSGGKHQHPFRGPSLDDEKRAMTYFMSKGWTKAQAAGIVGNLIAESGLQRNPLGWNDGGRAFGMGQWHADRQAEFKAWAHKDIRDSTWEEQLAFVQYELVAGMKKAAGEQLKRAKTAGEASTVVLRKYESPKDQSDRAAAQRALYAAQVARVDVTVNNNTGGSASVQANSAAATP